MESSFSSPLVPTSLPPSLVATEVASSASIGSPTSLQSFRATAIAAAILTGISWPLTILVNSLIIISLSREHALSRRNTSSIVRYCATICDILSAVIVQTLFIITTQARLARNAGSDCLPKSADSTRCLQEKVLYALHTGFLISSLLQLVMLQAARFITIKHTFRFTRIVTQHRIFIATAHICIVSVLVAVLSLTSMWRLYLIVYHPPFPPNHYIL